MNSPEHSRVEILELLTLVWKQIIQLPQRQRVALLLNSPGGEIEVFHLSGIVAIREIGHVLQISQEQYGRIWPELTGSPDPQDLENIDDDERFASLWNHLPLSDAQIAKILAVERQDVINLRMLARRKLRSKFAAQLGRGGLL